MANVSRPGKRFARRLGNWNKTTQFFEGLGFGVRESANRAIKKEVVEFKRQLIYNIMTQKYRGKWAALSKGYVKNKKQNKSMIYLHTEKYVNSLVVKYTNNRAEVGFRKGSTYKRGNTKVEVSLVALWLEYGTKGMPARPLWNPTWQDMGGTAGIKDRVAETIYRKLKNLSSGTGVKIDFNKVRRGY